MQGESGLGFGQAPIGRGKRDGPKVRRGFVELESDCGGSSSVLDTHDPAALFHLGLDVDQHNWLTRQELHLQLHQTAMRVHDDGLRLFLYTLSTWHPRTDDDRHLQHYTFAASSIGGVGIARVSHG
jgi:hypothetical protein